MEAIDLVRLKTSDKSAITREVSTGDGTSIYFKLGHSPILSAPAIEVRKNSVTVTNYTIDTSNGIITFDTAPAVNDNLDFTYYWAIFSDTEVQAFLDESGSNVTIASARLLLALAADAARLAKRMTLSGGGGMGMVIQDTSVAARELRDTAKALIQMESDLGESIPAEGLTEIPWTEFEYQKELEQSVIRNS